MAEKELTKRESYEKYLQDRCRLMLRDFFAEATKARLDETSSLKHLNDFITVFMTNHHLM